MPSVRDQGELEPYLGRRAALHLHFARLRAEAWRGHTHSVGTLRQRAAGDPFPTTNPALSDTRGRAVSQTIADAARRAQAERIRNSSPTRSLTRDPQARRGQVFRYLPDRNLPTRCPLTAV